MQNITKWEFQHSKKDIPYPSKKEYFKKMIAANAKLGRKMGWHAYFTLFPDKKKDDPKNMYGFKSGAAPPTEGVQVIQGFLNDLMELTTNVKFRKPRSAFQASLKSNLQEVFDENKVMVASDKKRHYYLFEKEKYNKLLQEHVTKTY